MTGVQTCALPIFYKHFLVYTHSNYGSIDLSKLGVSAMANCKYENTAFDLSECVDDIAYFLNEGKTLSEYLNSLTDYERATVSRIVYLAQDFTDAYYQLELKEG